MKTYKQCGVILINKSFDKMLIVYQRSSRKWGLPKGHMNEDEAHYDCAKRELYEETGIYLHFVKHRVLDTLVLHDKFFYVIQIKKDILYPHPMDKHEIVCTRWVSIEALATFTETHACNSTLNKLFKSIIQLPKKNYWHPIPARYYRHVSGFDNMEPLPTTIVGA